MAQILQHLFRYQEEPWSVDGIGTIVNHTQSTCYQLVTALLVLGATTASAQLPTGPMTEQQYGDLSWNQTHSQSNVFDGRMNSRERFGTTGDRYFQWRNQFTPGAYDNGWRFPERQQDFDQYTLKKEGFMGFETKPVRAGWARLDPKTGEFGSDSQRKMPQDFGPSFFYKQTAEAQKQANEAAGFKTESPYYNGKQGRATFAETLEDFRGFPAMTGPGKLANGSTAEGMPSPYWAAVQGQYAPTPAASTLGGEDAGIQQDGDRYEFTDRGIEGFAGTQQQALHSSMQAVDQQGAMAGFQSYNQNMGTTVDPGWYQDTFIAQRDHARANYPHVLPQAAQTAQAAAAPAQNSGFSQGQSAGSGGLGGMGFEDAGTQSSGSFARGF